MANDRFRKELRKEQTVFTSHTSSKKLLAIAEKRGIVFVLAFRKGSIVRASAGSSSPQPTTNNAPCTAVCVIGWLRLVFALMGFWYCDGIPDPSKKQAGAGGSHASPATITVLFNPATMPSANVSRRVASEDGRPSQRDIFASRRCDWTT